MSSAYLTIAGPIRAEIEVKRSRFLCQLQRIGSEDEARAVIAAVRKEHWKARHHCSANRSFDVVGTSWRDLPVSRF